MWSSSYKVVDFFSHSIKNVKTPSLCRAYEDLGLKHEPLTLIQPTFETPLPPLQPAVSGIPLVQSTMTTGAREGGSFSYSVVGVYGYRYSIQFNLFLWLCKSRKEPRDKDNTCRCINLLYHVQLIIICPSSLSFVTRFLWARS